MEYQIWRTDLKLIPDTYVTLGKKEIGFWKKKEVYYADLYFNGKHYFNIEGDEYNCKEETIKLFRNFYSTIFKIADRPFWKFQFQDFQQELWAFSKSNIFEDMWCNFGGYDITFYEEDGNFFLSCGKEFILRSEGDQCFVYNRTPKVLSETSYEPYRTYISRNCGELFLAIIREMVAYIGYDKKRLIMPYKIDGLFAFINQIGLQIVKEPKWVSLEIMNEIEKKGHYNELYKKRLLYL